MDFRLATKEDAKVIKHIMMEAFAVYNQTVPSSAMQEKINTIYTRLANKEEQALICFQHNTPVGIVRFQIREHELYFYRLAILPHCQGRGTGRLMVRWLERYAKERKCVQIWCKVRKEVRQNVAFYHSLDFTIFDEFTVYTSTNIPIKVQSMKKLI